MLNDLYEQLFKLSKDGLLIIRDNIVLECNDAFVNMLGYSSKDEVLKLHLSDFFPKYQADGSFSLDKAKMSKEKAIKESEYSFEWVHCKKSGKEIYTEVILKPILHNNKPAIFATVRDIQEKKLLEIKNEKLKRTLEQRVKESTKELKEKNISLQQTQSFLNNVIDNAPFRIFWKDKNSIYLGANKQFLQNFNIEKKEDLIGTSDLENEWKLGTESVIDDKEVMDTKVAKISFEEIAIFENAPPVYMLTSKIPLLDENNDVIGILGIHDDITKYKNTYLKLIESKNFLETIYNTVNEGLAVINYESKFININDAYKNMLGFTEEEIYSKSCIELTKDSMIKELKRILVFVLRDGFYNNFEKTCIGANDKEIDVVVDIIKIPNKKQLLLVVKDITKENRLKKEKKLQDEQMIQQSRLAQMGEMISMIAHQWRQPLGAISTSAINLKLKLQLEVFKLDTKKSREDCEVYFIERLETIEEYVESLTNTVDDFRNFYKPNKNSIKITMESVLQKTLKIIKDSLSNDGIEIIYISDSYEEIEMYDGEMMQVFLNIFKNAQDNFHDKKIQNPKIKIIVQDKVVSVTDNGGGIPHAIQEKIFDPYFSTKDKKNGTGLGLYMSKIILEDHHNGKLYYKNSEDGACFTINLDGVLT